MDQERICILALHFLPGVGDFLVKQLISYCGSAEEVFRQSKVRLLKIPGIGDITAQAIRHSKTHDRAEKEVNRAEKEGVQLLCFTDKGYPSRLKSIEDAPAILYIKGNTNLNHPRTVAIVGTRRSTPYGRYQVERLVEELKVYDALIISGLAYGIDIHAHKQALKHGLQTIGVLGSGLDIIYPATHKDIANKMIDQGALVTENHFGTNPEAHNFPARNRIIAGLCDALVVVEAAERGGALITAEIANTYNKDVFAIPGNLGNTFSEGCNKLIKINKASLLMSVRDLEYIMNWNSAKSTNDPQLALNLNGFESDEKTVMEVLRQKNTPVMIDELSIRTGLSQGLLSSLLLSLEFKNAIISLPGKRYREK